MKKNILLLSIFLLSGCVATAPEKTFTLTPELLQQRQLETRKYEGIKEEALLSASANVLQDLGFNLENSETKLGLLTANKQRDATNAGQIALSIALALLGGGSSAVDRDQTIRVSLVARPALASNGLPQTDSHLVRVTFQRILRRSDNTTSAQTLSNPELYQDFYDRLSKSVFLQAQNI